MELNNDQMIAMIEELAKELAALKAEEHGTIAVAVTTVKKNQKPGKASPTRKYVLLSQSLSNWGKVPQQQADIAKILVANMVVGQEYTEAQVFSMLVDGCGDYTSLYKSAQDPTYLFRYYRGLKNDGKHAGYIARNFVRMVD